MYMIGFLRLQFCYLTLDLRGQLLLFFHQIMQHREGPQEQRYLGLRLLNTFFEYQPHWKNRSKRRLRQYS